MFFHDTTACHLRTRTYGIATLTDKKTRKQNELKQSCICRL